MISFIIYKYDKLYNKSLIDNKILKYKEYYNFNNDPIKINNQHIGLVYFNDDLNNNNLKFKYIYENNDYIILFIGYPFGIKTILKNSDNIDIFKFYEEIKSDPKKIQYLSPPLLLIVYNKNDKSINIINDGIGLIKTYEYENKNGIFYSNNIYPLILFSRIKPKVNINMLMINYLFNGIHYNETLYQNINFLKGGTNIIIYDKKIIKNIYDLFQSGDWVKNDKRQIIFNNLCNFIDEFDIFFSDNMKYKLALTGGRDSRLLAALFINRNRDIEYYYNMYDENDKYQINEKDTGKKLLKIVNLENKYKINVNNMKNNNTTRHKIHDRFINFFKKYDGIYPYQYLCRNIDISHNTFNIIIISGLAGEFLRNFYYDYNDYTKYKDDPYNFIDIFCDKYFNEKNNKHIKNISIIKSLFKNYLLNLVNNHKNNFDFMEILYINHMTSYFNYNTNIIMPYYNVSIIRNILNFDRNMKLSDKYYKQYIKTLIPEWNNINFIKNCPIKNQYKLDNNDKKYLLNLINSSIELKNIFDIEYLKNIQKLNDNTLYKLAHIAYFEKHIEYMYNNS